MTTIIAKVSKSKVEFGADSLVSSSRKYSHPNMVKIVERGPYLIAGSGLSAPCDIIQHIWKPPTPIQADRSDMYHFVISRVIPSMKDCFKYNEYKWDESNEETKFNFLLAIGGEVYDIGDDFAVCIDAGGIYGIGSGASFAVGALKAGATIEKALEIAAEIDPYTASPFHYYEQERWIK
jgi:ATP-dependent protease HslVU (ClpYQ) peptidase subunit